MYIFNFSFKLFVHSFATIRSDSYFLFLEELLIDLINISQLFVCKYLLCFEVNFYKFFYCYFIIYY